MRGGGQALAGMPGDGGPMGFAHEALPALGYRPFLPLLSAGLLGNPVVVGGRRSWLIGSLQRGRSVHLLNPICRSTVPWCPGAAVYRVTYVVFRESSLLNRVPVGWPTSFLAIIEPHMPVYQTYGAVILGSLACRAMGVMWVQPICLFPPGLLDGHSSLFFT